MLSADPLLRYNSKTALDYFSKNVKRDIKYINTSLILIDIKPKLNRHFIIKAKIPLVNNIKTDGEFKVPISTKNSQNTKENNKPKLYTSFDKPKRKIDLFDRKYSRFNDKAVHLGNKISIITPKTAKASTYKERNFV